jgi:predicted RNA-binding protein with PUA-like domain
MARMNWMFKEEPGHYGFDALVADGRTTWSGVRNPVAQKHLHAVKRGDRIFYYHTGSEKAVVGVAAALGDAYADPDDPSGGFAVVDVGPVRKLPRPVTLAEIKADASFENFPLVRIGRLSVMPVSDAEWARIEKMAQQAALSSGPARRARASGAGLSGGAGARGPGGKGRTGAARGATAAGNRTGGRTAAGRTPRAGTRTRR